MSTLPKITVVTPSYNQSAYLEATLRSVLDQGYPNLEYIVMDGGSTDGSEEIIKKFADRLAYWESGRDEGHADAVNRGFARSSGEILAFVNSDDLLLPGALGKVGRWFCSHPEEEWLVGGTVNIGPDGRPVRGRRIKAVCCSLSGRITFASLLYFGCGFSQPASFWRREAFFAVGGLDTSCRFSFDYDFFLKLASRRPSGHINDYLACFRCHPAAKTSTLQDVRRADDERLFRKYGRYHKSAIDRKVLYVQYALRCGARRQYSRLLHYLHLKRCPV